MSNSPSILHLFDAWWLQLDDPAFKMSEYIVPRVPEDIDWSLFASLGTFTRSATAIPLLPLTTWFMPQTLLLSVTFAYQGHHLYPTE